MDESQQPAFHHIALHRIALHCMSLLHASACCLATHRLQDLHGARLLDVVRKVLGEGLRGRDGGMGVT